MTTCDAPPDQELLSTTYTGDDDHVRRTLLSTTNVPNFLNR